MSALWQLPNTFRHAIVSEREKGSCFEELIPVWDEAINAALPVMNVKHVRCCLQTLLSDGDSRVNVEDAATIMGCWEALSNQGALDGLIDNHGGRDRPESHQPTIHQLAAAQQLPLFNMGDSWQFSRKNIRAWINHWSSEGVGTPERLNSDD